MSVSLRLGVLLLFVAACSATAPTPKSSAGPTSARDCAAYAPLPPADAEIQHVKTSVKVVEVLSACTVRVRVASMPGAQQRAAASLSDQLIVLRATTRTTYQTAAQGDLGAIGRSGMKPGDGFTLSFDSRQFPDGSYPLNFMNW